jgi:hypothetical protein
MYSAFKEVIKIKGSHWDEPKSKLIGVIINTIDYETQKGIRVVRTQREDCVKK